MVVSSDCFALLLAKIIFVYHQVKCVRLVNQGTMETTAEAAVRNLYSALAEGTVAEREARATDITQVVREKRLEKINAEVGPSIKNWLATKRKL